jgi:hypothetical protein
MKKNQWRIMENLEYAYWIARLPTKKMLDKRRLWEFLKEVLIAGEENEIFRITETSKFSENDKKYYFNLNRGESYVDFADRVLEEEGESLIWQIEDSAYGGALTRLSYYGANGDVEEKELAYPASALKENRPELDEYYLYPIGAIVLSPVRGGAGYSDDYDELMDGEFIEDGVRYISPRLMIRTNTSIWFPKVMGGYDEPLEDRGWDTRQEDGEWVDPKEGEWYDNSELALRHTPRLNKFIQRVKQLTLNYGGTWKTLHCDTADRYHSQWNEDGIILPS